MKPIETRAPDHLSGAAQRLWTALVFEWSINDEAGQLILTVGLECWDRMKQAQRRVKKDGLMIKDRFGQEQPHPMLRVERESRAHLLMALKQLDLNLDALEAA